MTKTALVTGFALLLSACHSTSPGATDTDAAGPGVGYVTITARANHLLVGGALIADHLGVDEGAEYEIVDNSDGTIAMRQRANGLYVAPDTNGRLVAASTAIGANESFERFAQPDGWSALRSVGNGQFVSADLDEGGVLIADRLEVGGAWEQFGFDPAPRDPVLGANTLVFTPSLRPEVMQARLDLVFARMETDQFGGDRYAVLFAPGAYQLDVNVGYYTEVLGLGAAPDDVTIAGAVHAEADWFDGNATHNFWRSVANLAMGSSRWAVSQAAPLRRVHVRGSLQLDDGGWASGGFLADSRIDDTVASGTQQQWLSRSSAWGQWTGQNWNMVFVGVDGAPSGNAWPDPPYTTVDRVPVVREKPFLLEDGVFVPALRENSHGTSWSDGPAAGTTIPLRDFHIARAELDTAASLNAALADGKHLLFTPGIYHLDDTLEVTRAGTVVLGIGLATLVADGGVDAMHVADVDGVVLAGLLFDAGETSSDTLLQIGPPGSSADHAADPITLHDIFVRVGGADVGRAAVGIAIHSDDVIGDHFWIWRADHSYGVGWDLNTTENGLVVDGDDVTIYGLFVEHQHRNLTLWNGERGRVYFYQSEMPYDVPSQSAWSSTGYASYKVAGGVTRHEAWGLGIYCFFNDDPGVTLRSAIEAPETANVRFHHVVTVSLGGRGTISHAVNDRGAAAGPGSGVAHLGEYP
jgi:hypothetical protein